MKTVNVLIKVVRISAMFAFPILLSLTIRGSVANAVDHKIKDKAMTSSFHGNESFTREQEIEALGRSLQKDGLEGWVHGAISERNLYVFTWRDPKNFFRAFEFPLVTYSAEVVEVLSQLQRHDQVRIYGNFVEHGAPIRHIVVERIEVVKLAERSQRPEGYEYQTRLPSELYSGTDIIARVHAVAADGAALVIEFGDAVVPVLVKDTKVTRTLYRGDKIRLHYVVRGHPYEPSHLNVNSEVAEPIEILERIKVRHGQTETLEGELILFPESVQVSFNVFAIAVKDEDGITLIHTVVNFEDPKLFKAIREKLQGYWDQHPEAVETARNKFINPKLRVRATGKINVVDQGQANPQILIDSLEDVEVIVSNQD
jgi:hypothetical protein